MDQNKNQNPFGFQMPYRDSFYGPANGQNWDAFENWGQTEGYGGILYPAYSGDMENQSDVRYMKELYPELAREVQVYVDEECDRMEYEGSMMYDEYPDRVLVYQAVRHILNRLMEKGILPMPENNPMNENVMDECDGNGACGSEIQGMASRKRSNVCSGRGCRNQQMEDFIQVIFLNEMFKRRAERRNRRRRYW